MDKYIKFKFNLSNADTAIYLDAIQVLKENAYPKVSYTIEPSVVDQNFLYTAYNQLNRICNINDTELKLENVQGYISELELDLDHPENDHFEIKNYKTKFEDLFSSIVAQTEAMKKSAYTIGLAAQAFTSTGDIQGDILQQSIGKVDLNYAFNNGHLTIDAKNGIWGTSDSGVVAFRGGGIFTATDKDSAGNWKWNTGIVPQGINANLITTGQLDTNKINIYAGDKVRFQLNGEGLYAYKSFFEDQNLLDYASDPEHSDVADTLADNTTDKLDVAQYVVMNENGLFLMAKAGALVLNDDKTDFVEIAKDVKRVEVSWDGFKLRNWNNDEVFWADPSTGNLRMRGVVYATGLYIVGDKSQDEVTDEDKLEKYLTTQIPKTTYTSSEPSDPKEGDFWYDTTKKITYQYKLKSTAEDGTKTYEWQPVALETKIWRQEDPPVFGTYSIGDIWFQLMNGENGQYTNERICISLTGYPYADFVIYNAHQITGAFFSVETETGVVSIQSARKMELVTNGVLSITGDNGITMGSEVAINMAAGSSINMFVESDENKLKNSVLTINKKGINLTAGSIIMNANTSLDMQSGGVLRLVSKESQGSYILLGANQDGSGGVVSLTSNGIVAPTGAFNSLTINGLPALTKTWVNKPIIVSYSRPTTGGDFIWIQPSSSTVETTSTARDETINLTMEESSTNKTWGPSSSVELNTFSPPDKNFDNLTNVTATYYYTANVRVAGLNYHNSSAYIDTEIKITGASLTLTNGTQSVKLTSSTKCTLHNWNYHTLEFTSGPTSVNVLPASAMSSELKVTFTCQPNNALGIIKSASPVNLSVRLLATG